jgi:two-component system response regulator FixJ
MLLGQVASPEQFLHVARGAAKPSSCAPAALPRQRWLNYLAKSLRLPCTHDRALTRRCRMESEGRALNVYVVDDDREVRSSLQFQLGTLDYKAVSYANADDFLSALEHLPPGCVLLDIRMAGTDGIEALRALATQGIDWPVIMMTGHAEVPLAVAAMKGGAIDLLEKPFEEELLIAALARGYAKLSEQGQQRTIAKALKTKLAMLSPREREVLRHLVTGVANKRVATILGLSVRTVEMHRANLLRKLDVKSLAEAAVYAPML